MARNSRKSYEIDMLNGPILPKDTAVLRSSYALHDAATAVQRGGCRCGGPVCRR